MSNFSCSRIIMFLDKNSLLNGNSVTWAQDMLIFLFIINPQLYMQCAVWFFHSISKRHLTTHKSNHRDILIWLNFHFVLVEHLAANKKNTWLWVLLLARCLVISLEKGFTQCQGILMGSSHLIFSSPVTQKPHYSRNLRTNFWIHLTLRFPKLQFSLQDLAASFLKRNHGCLMNELKVGIKYLTQS